MWSDRMPQRAPATRESWRNKPFPAQREPLPFDGRFEGDEVHRLTQGLVPEGVEDKWFIFYEEGWLYLHRAITGSCIYAVRLSVSDGAAVVDEAWVNADPGEYTATDRAWDLALLGFLVNDLLAGRPQEFPVRTSLPEDKQLNFQHTVVGRRRRSWE